MRAEQSVTTTKPQSLFTKSFDVHSEPPHPMLDVMGLRRICFSITMEGPSFHVCSALYVRLSFPMNNELWAGF
jgi:hypothetical protein